MKNPLTRMSQRVFHLVETKKVSPIVLKAKIKSSIATALKMGPTGIEPVASCVSGKRSPS